MMTLYLDNDPKTETFKPYFLADVQHRLALHCCRLLAEMTAHTGKSFLTLARRGCSPTREEIVGERDELSMHEEAYRSVRSAIAASCTLSHRSCHVLWGPRGCGEHRILRLVAQDCMQRDGTLVLYLDGDTLNGDEDGLRCIAHQILRFLRSPQSLKLREADWSLRTGTFDFGALFGFPKLLQRDDEGSEDRESDDGDNDGGGGDNNILPVRGGGGTTGVSGENTSSIVNWGNDRMRNRKRLRPQSPVDSESEDENINGESDMFLVTSTMATGTGGVASALPALQRCLLLMKGYGTNLVICIRRVERFGIWCDQLLYVLSGLMHESDGRGGGMSLVMTSSTPDIRQLEKRLSSRLTCETRCIPLLPWSATRVARACLVEMKESLENHLKKRAAAAKTTKTKEKDDGNNIDETPDGNLSVNEMVRFAHPFTGWRFDVCSAAQGREKALLNTSADLSHSSTQIIEEAMLRMVMAAIKELNTVSQLEQESLTENVFARCITRVSKDLRSVGATAGRVVASVSSVFGEVCSGKIHFLNAKNRSSNVQWLTKRLSKKIDYSNSLSGMFLTAPEAVRALWLSSSSKKTSEDLTVSAAARTTLTSFSSACSPVINHQLLFDDLLSDCRLVELGYCSRETFLILVYICLRHEAGAPRTVVDLLEDVSSSMGTQAAIALDRGAFRTAIAALHRWRILCVAGKSGSGVVSLRCSPARLRGFLQSVLHKADHYGSVLGLEAKELTRLRSLI